MRTHADVLVVGAGPTGLMLATQLARRGVRTIIIDRHAGPVIETRALGVQARTLEIYAQLGIVDQALALGTRAVGAHIWRGGRQAARVSLGAAGQDLTPYPYLLILGQDDNERLLADALARHGMAVQWNTELTGITQDADHVTTSLRGPDGGITTLAVGWVAGCDGARSTVRELSGIPFEGAPYEQVFFVADTQATGAMVADHLNVYLWRGGFHLFFPMRGVDHWRVVGILPRALRDRDDLTFEDVAGAVRREAGTGLTFRSCSWFSTYRIHHRRAARFRDRRCFVLGDAAHVHSPVGAQGMNTGLQDAYNLAWKLALVVTGRAAPGLLDSYDEERRPVAGHLLHTTDRAFTMLVSDGRLAGTLRSWLLPNAMGLAMRFAAVQGMAFRTISQTGIRYRRSTLSVTLDDLPSAAPQAGDRFPWFRARVDSPQGERDLFEVLDDMQFHLLLIGQDASRDLGDGIQVHAIPTDPPNDQALARTGIGTPAFFLVRPDGHVGLAGGRLDAGVLREYLAGRLLLRP